MGHHITVQLDNKDISLELHCTEAPEAWCRAETRGECVYRQYLPEDVLVESYDGSGTELHSAPVEFNWDGESYSWNYTPENRGFTNSPPLTEADAHKAHVNLAGTAGRTRLIGTVVPLRRDTDETSR
ncbi:Uncharacterised protein [Mycobacteroides abscessus subsp. abscessus]|uniref:hypothetical protein n=1 Tax=Mycobacteroides abscessus TaxID=36809 RepID=UPI0009A76DE4|nr:hypothetical protein [Mycobacteroides abscessus]SLI00763.1 Uncharacterised protein [Mycobacteroides abscessus subsp. abscessus]